MTEGYFRNRGTSNLIFILKVYNFLWGPDSSGAPASCDEFEYYDNKNGMCSSKFFLFKFKVVIIVAYIALADQVIVV